eukprot:jgi/Tetstr1/458899/TSEL_000366.t1
MASDPRWVEKCGKWSGEADWRQVLPHLEADPQSAAEKDGNGDLPLHWAAATQAPVEVAEALLAAHQAGAKEKNSDGNLPLHSAVQNKAPVEVVEALLAAHQAGAKEKDSDGRLPLHWAAWKQAPLEVVEALLAAHQAGAAEKDSDGNLPLYLAAANKAPVEVVEALLAAHQAGAAEKDRNGNLPLHSAVQNKAPVEVVEALLAAHQAGAAEKDRNGRLPLHSAAEKQAPVEVVEALLVAHQAGAKERDSGGSLPLHRALMNKAPVEVVEALLAAHQAGAAEKDSDGRLPLHRAAENQAPVEVVEAMLGAHPAGAEEKDGNGELPLHLVAKSQAPVEVVEALLTAHQAGAKEKDRNGWLPLHLAAGSKASVEVVEALLAAHPAGAAEKDGNGELPLHLVAKNQAPVEVVEALLAAHQAGAKEKDSVGWLPLHYAAASKAPVEVLEALLAAHQAGAAEKNSDGRLPLHLVAKNQAPVEVVEALLAAHQAGAKEKDSDDNLPLYWAVQNKAPVEVLEALLTAHQAGAAEKDSDGKLPLHWALMNKAPVEVVEALLAAHQAAAAEKDSFGDLPLHRAAWKQAPVEVVEALLAAHQAGAAEKDSRGDLPLHRAAWKQAPVEVVEALLAAHQAGAAEKGSGGRLPLHWALMNKARVEVVEALLAAHQAGAAEKDSFGNLPLHRAAWKQAPVEVVEALLAAHPAAVTVPDSKQQLPHQLAASSSPEVLVAMITAFGSPNVAAAPAALAAWQGIVSLKMAAEGVRQAVEARQELAHGWTLDGRSAYQQACGECRQAMDDALAFLGRYLVLTVAHRSATCTVLLAEDMQAGGQLVALKLMRQGDSFLREVALRQQHQLSSDFVVNVLRVHLAAEVSGVAGIEERLHQEAAGVEVHLGKDFGRDAQYSKYCFCVVMPQAERSLSSAITQGRAAAGDDWPLVRFIATNLANALDHLHKRDIVHGDIKPLNVMRSGDTYKLIDLDVAAVIGKPLGNKRPSSAHCAPEVAKLLIQCDKAAAEERRSEHVVGPIMEQLTADEAQDLWGFGVTLFHLGSGSSLWHRDDHTDDIADPEDLQRLADWDEGTARQYLRRLRATKGQPDKMALFDLVEKLLVKDPGQRRANFPNGMASVLEHPFLGSRTLDDATLEALNVKVDHDDATLKQIQQSTEGLHVVEQLSVLGRMMTTLLSHGAKSVPTLVLLLPHQSQGGMLGKLNPKTWMSNQVAVFFVDPVDMTRAATNDGKGFILECPKEVLVKAVPYLKVAATVLKAAALAGRLAGILVPDLGGFLQEMTTSLGTLQQEGLDVLSQTFKMERGDVESALEGIGAKAEGLLDEAKSAAEGAELKANENEALVLERSAAQLAALLDETHPGWREPHKLGLQKETSPKDGCTEWVKPENVALFRAKGAACLAGKASEQPAEHLGSVEAALMEAEMAKMKVEAEKEALLVEIRQLKADAGGNTGGRQQRRAPHKGVGASTSAAPQVGGASVEEQLQCQQQQYQKELRELQEQLQQKNKGIMEAVAKAKPAASGVCAIQ